MPNRRLRWQRPLLNRRQKIRSFPWLNNKVTQDLPKPVPAAPQEMVLPDGTHFRDIPMREALRDALAEEMRRDGDVFIMGEEVAEYEGAYKVTQGLLAEFGAKRVD